MTAVLPSSAPRALMPIFLALEIAAGALGLRAFARLG